jgi:hypothetical protein
MMPTRRELVIEMAVMVAIGVALAALGPFGTFVMGSFANRLAYWLPASLFGYVVFRPVLAVARAQAKRLELPDSGALLAGVVAAAAPVTLLVLWWSGQGFGARPRFGDWFELYLHVALIGALATLTFVAIEKRGTPVNTLGPRNTDEGRAATSPPAAQSGPPFLARLPASRQGQLTALEMEDHYVRAHSPGASMLILMRLRDAEAELAGMEGLRVHRSWWVARAAVEQVVRDGRNVRLRLKGGIEAPVARDRLPVLREFGWLEA